MLFCHATLRNDTEIFTRLTPEDRLLPVFEGLGVSAVVCGHTHMPFDRMIGTSRVVAGRSACRSANPAPIGSCSAPMFSFGTPTKMSPERLTRFARTKYPQAEDFAARNILQPPSEEETLAAFTCAELK